MHHSLTKLVIYHRENPTRNHHRDNKISMFSKSPFNRDISSVTNMTAMFFNNASPCLPKTTMSS
ncbi:MAG: hypothetical protein GDA51_12560 [Ekhidna sp.]|nr:hypothetical protein [Ekhidna sp.]